MLAIKDLSEGNAQHFTTLVKDGLHHSAEQLFIAAKVCHLVARHTNHGTLNLGRRIEDTRLDSKEIFHMVPGLNQYR